MNNRPATEYKHDAPVVQYWYGANGQRAIKLVGSPYTWYVPGAHGKSEILYNHSTNNPTYNLWGRDNVGQVQRNGSTLPRYYYLKDHLGTIRMTVDTGGTVVGYNDYYPYGMTMAGRSLTSGSVDGRYQFTGKERDAVETGYDYFGARYYDAWGGKFLAVDPHASTYPGMSPYCYAGNNPMAFVDPTGMDTTFYVVMCQSQLDPVQASDVANQTQSDLDQNGIPMSVNLVPEGGIPVGVIGSDFDANGIPMTLEVVTRPIILDDTDVRVDLRNDNDTRVRDLKERDPQAEGYMPPSGRWGFVTTGALGRNGINLTGLGNLVAHEGVHAMGIRDDSGGSLMTGRKTSGDANRSTQTLTGSQIKHINEIFLKPKK